MFSIHNFKKTAQGQRHKFQALAPLLRSNMPLSSESMEKALVRGLFRSVLLSYMALPDCTYDAYRVARALQIACDEASSRGESASAAHISGGQSAIACPCPSWITDMQDAASAIIALHTGCDSHLGAFAMGETHALHRVRHATTGSLLLLANSIKKEPWATMARVL